MSASQPQRVDARMLRALLSNLDNHAARRGWDKRPGLFVLYDEREPRAQLYCQRFTLGPACSAGPYAARTLIPKFIFEGVGAVTLLRRFAVGFTTADPRVALMLGLLQLAPFRGLALVTEAAAGRLIHVADVDGRSHQLVHPHGGGTEMAAVPEHDRKSPITASLEDIVQVVRTSTAPEARSRR